MGGTRLCVGVLGPSEGLSRLRRAARLPEKLQKPRAPDPLTHTRTRWGRRAFCGHGVEKREGLAGLRPPTGRRARRCVLRAVPASRPGEGLSDVGTAGAFRLRGWTDATCGELRGSGGRRRSALGRLLFLLFCGFPAGEEFVGLRFAAADTQHNTTASAAQQRPGEWRTRCIFLLAGKTVSDECWWGCCLRAACG
ncbi:uncharacterized protein Tco025E_08081, partial [Trypanosoma conorhini]